MPITENQPRVPRKKRIDAGKQRKPAPSEREAWREFFAHLTPREQVFELGYLTALSLASDRDLTNIVLKEADRLAGPTKLEQEAAKDMRADMFGENGNG